MNDTTFLFSKLENFFHAPYLSSPEFLSRKSSRKFVLGLKWVFLEQPLLYNVFTSYAPTPHSTLIATFADNTVILASHKHSILAVGLLRSHLNKTSHWTKRWKMKSNEDKCVEVNFNPSRNEYLRLNVNNTKHDRETSRINSPNKIQTQTCRVRFHSLKPMLNSRVNLNNKISICKFNTIIIPNNLYIKY